MGGYQDVIEPTRISLDSFMDNPFVSQHFYEVMFSPEFENPCPSYALRPINQFRNGHSLRMGSIAKAREAETQRGERECRHRCSYSPVRFEHEQAQAALTFFPLLNSYSSSCKFTLCLNLSQQNS